MTDLKQQISERINNLQYGTMIAGRVKGRRRGRALKAVSALSGALAVVITAVVQIVQSGAADSVLYSSMLGELYFLTGVIF